MNEKEVGELRRRLRPEKNSITHIRGCYVNEMGESVAQFDQSLALMTQEETETLLALLRRTLSGTLGKNLLDLSFETRQVVEGEEHRRLMRLRDTALKDEEAVEEFFQLVRQSLTLEGNYLILLVYDRYDVPYRAKDGERQEDAAAEVRALLRKGLRVSAVFMGEDASAADASRIYGKNMARIRGMDQLARAAGRLIQNEIRELGD